MPPPPDLPVLMVQIQFPGMPRPESDVAKLWLQRHGHEYDRIEFNVRLGDGIDPGAGTPAYARRQAVMATQKRADVIAWLHGRATIIEVKIRVGLGAIGQLLGYQFLYMRAFPEQPEPRLLVVARLADGDVQPALVANGIDLVLYERA